MPLSNNNFNQSINYFYTVRDSVSNYEKRYAALLHNLTRHTYQDVRKGKADYKITALVSSDYLRNQTRAVKDGKDYRVYNLLKNAHMKTTVKIKDKFNVVNSLTFGFKNKFCMKDFIKDMGFKKDEIVCAGWLNDEKLYCFIIKFDKGIPDYKLKGFKTVCGKLQYYSKRYGEWGIIERVYIPSTIHDRWYDAFALKMIWDANTVFDHAARAKALTLDELYKRFNPQLNKAELYYNSKACSNFISNSDRITVNSKKVNTYIVNHYLNNYNPYKKTNCRKDWKLAAEAFLNEFCGKVNYNLNQDKEYLQFSKSEITLFLRSLNLNTKIDANTFKRCMLRFLIEMHFVETDFKYKPKVECRKYTILKDYLKKLYSIILQKLDRIIFIDKYIYMQKFAFIDSFIEKVIAKYTEQLSFTYMGPPPRKRY